MTSTPSKGLKIAILGPVGDDVKEFTNFLADSLGGPPVSSSVFGGCTVYRAELTFPISGEESVDLRVFASTAEADFKGIFSFLFEDVAGVICLLPAALGRAEESRKVLATLHGQWLIHYPPQNYPPFLLQYHWREADLQTSPEEIDRALGVNPKAVNRVYSRYQHPDQLEGITALLKLIESRS